MAAVYYLLICFAAGYFMLKKVMPSLFNINDYTGLAVKNVRLPGWLVIFPSSFLTGTLIVTWLTYLAAYMARDTGNPMFYGTLTILLLLTAVVAAFIFSETVKKRWSGLGNTLFADSSWTEAILVLILFVVAAFLMFYTFFISKGTIFIGLSVFGDFGPHMAMIRSFSHGANFPTEYPFFPDGTIRYHFMFQFLAGVLEFLGLRFDFAFNVPSILAYVSFLLLLYAIAVIITGRKAAGIITCVLFFFRSSFTFFAYLGDLLEKKMNFGQLLMTILTNDEFVGKTANENWGLWNQKVFVNQRHLAFSLGIMLIILIYVYPLFIKAYSGWKDKQDKKDNMSSGGNNEEGISNYEASGSKEAISINEALSSNKTENSNETRIKIATRLRKMFAAKESWLPQNITSAVFLGIVLGLLSFWNGAVVFAVLPVLFILAIVSAHRLEYLIIAVLTVCLSYIETNFFTGNASDVVKPIITIGFLAEDKSISGIIEYLVRLLGILPFVIATAITIMPEKGRRWLTLAFLAPMLFAFTVQLTPDINVNHKYVIISVLLLNIIAADFLVRLAEKRFTAIVAGLLAIILTLTGIFDFITLVNMNNPNNINGKRPFTLSLNDPLTKWVEKNTDPKDIFLSDAYFIHPLLVSGRKIFLGWIYFSWSAGYDTTDRANTVKELFNAKSEEELKRLTEENNISYIIVDQGLRSSKEYKVNEQLIASVYKKVYDNKDTKTVIYKVKAD